MHGFIKILLLFFAVQFPLHTAVEAGSQHAEIRPGETHRSPFSFPDHQSTLYAIYHQSENAAEIGDRVPQPESTSERRFKPFDGSPPESVIERQLTIYFWVCGLIDPGLSIKKLIFPFHFFL